MYIFRDLYLRDCTIYIHVANNRYVCCVVLRVETGNWSFDNQCCTGLLHICYLPSIQVHTV